MRFEIPGLHAGLTDTDVARVSRHDLIVRQGTAEDEAEAARRRLGLSAAQFRALQASLAALKR